MENNNIPPDEEIAEEVPAEVHVEEPVEDPAPVAPAAKERGRPKGSKNKPKVVAVSVEEEEPPEPEPPIPEPPKLRRQARPKAAPKAVPGIEEAPPTPQEVAAYMLASSRQRQHDRADCRQDKYAAWFS